MEQGKIHKPIRVARGEVVGIGKFKIPKTVKFDYEIQLLSFLSIKESDDSFISTCIHLHIDGYGKTEEEADRNMMKNASFFLSQNFNKLSIEDAWDNLRDLFKSDDWSNELWTAYHEFQIQLSMQGYQMIDPAAELFSHLSQFVKREKELEIWAGELEKARNDLENRENQLEKDRIEMMGTVWVLANLISKMRLSGVV